MRHPNRYKCLQFLNEYGTPDHVINHCKSVAAVAYIIGKALNDAGGTRAAAFKHIRMKKFVGEDSRTYYEQDNSAGDHDHDWRPFDLDLVLSGGLLHDMARVKNRHWDVCADWCHGMKYYEEEMIVRVHMMYQYTNDANHLTEADLITLGDRLTLEDHYAGLDERMEYIIRKTERKGNYDAREAILKKKEETRRLLGEIEDRIGISIDELMSDIDYENVEKAE